MAVLNRKEVDIMAIVITNGNYYIYLNQNGKHRKTKDVTQALQYSTIKEAIRYMNHAPIKQMVIMYMIHLLIMWYGSV